MERVRPDRTFWVFPGGGVEESDQSYTEALKRECREEMGVEVQVGKLVWDRDFREGELEKFYLCQIVSGKIGEGKGPEYDGKGGYVGTHEAKWLPLVELINYDLLPNDLRDEIVKNYKRGIKTGEDWAKADWSGLNQASAQN